MREEICGPLEIDFSVGLAPDEEARSVEVTCLDDGFRPEIA